MHPTDVKTIKVNPFPGNQHLQFFCLIQIRILIFTIYIYSDLFVIEIRDHAAYLEIKITFITTTNYLVTEI